MDQRLNRRWGLVAVSVLANMCLGTIYSWSVFRAPLEIELSLSPARTGLPYSIFLAFFAFSMPVGGLLMPRLGTRLTLALGGLMVGAGWALAGLASTFGGLTVAYGALGGIGVGLAYGVPLAVCASWFPARRGLAMGLALAGFGMSPFVTAPLAEFLILTVGVRTAMVTLGIAFSVIVVGLAPLFRARPHLPEPAPGASPSEVSPPVAVTGAVPAPGVALESGAAPTIDVAHGPGEMMRRGAFYALWVCFAIGTLAGLTAIGMTASYGEEIVGISGPAAAALVALFGVLNGVGRPLFGALHDRLGTRRTMVVAYALVAAGALVAMTSGPGRIATFVVGFGILWLMLGGWLAIAPAATTRLFGAAGYARNYGIVYTAYGVGALVGGAASGVLLTRFGSYRPLFAVVVALALVGVGVARVGIPSGSARALDR